MLADMQVSSLAVILPNYAAARQIFPGIVQRDRMLAGIEPRQGQAIGQHLGEGVGEFGRGQFMKHLVAEGLEQAIEAAFLMQLSLPD